MATILNPFRVRESSQVWVSLYLTLIEGNLVKIYASVAQLVEQGTENPRVIGSIPIGGTIYKRP